VTAILAASATTTASVANTPVAGWQRRTLYPAHEFERAADIHNTTDLRTRDASALVDAFDAIAATMLIVDRHARIIHVNTAGCAMLAEGSAVRAVGGKLKTTDAHANRALQEAFANLGRGDITVASKDIFVPVTACDDELYVVQVLPLTSRGQGVVDATHSAVATVFVRKARLDLPNCMEMIGKHYNLTRGENRVLAGIVEIGGVPQLAGHLGTSETTVKTHLGHIFQKTGTKRQVDLVKLIARFMSVIG
jgi:DNA-binding CsgD family transcriptional regulator